MSNMVFGIAWGGWENIFVVAPLVGLVVGLLYYRYRRTVLAVRALTNFHRATQQLLGYSRPKKIMKSLFFAIGVLFLGIALLKPQWDKKEQMVTQEGRDLFIALDISRSMLAKDCEPNRLTCAKNKIKSLVSQLSTERVGLLLFSGSALVQCPLTTDYSAFFMFLDAVDAETISSGSTAIDQAVARVIEAFGATPERKNKLLVLFTDGEDFSSHLQTVKANAQKAGLHIFTVGVGTPEGAPIPLIDDEGRNIGHQKDKKGAVVISRLNEGILSTLATDVGGTYIKLTADDGDIHHIIRQVTRFEKEKIDEKRITHLQEQYPSFLWVSFIMFMLEWLL